MGFLKFAPTLVGTASSVGLEHYFDRVGVTGSNPVQSTSSAEALSETRSEGGQPPGFISKPWRFF